MNFAEFYVAQKALMSEKLPDGREQGINVEPGTPGFYDLIRLWNGLAQLNPDHCDDVVQVFGVETHEMRSEPNPFRVEAPEMRSEPNPPSRTKLKARASDAIADSEN